ncbi:hypothetical protein Leryth_005628 [Lithospermum erythrorhizon]|nr:hypothetical protein Leryth_005628 [Lithospermum erythrorhizon]
MAGKKSGDANKQEAAATAKKQQAAENAKKRGAEAEAEAEAAANAKKRELQSKKQMAAPGTTDITPTIANGYNVRDYDWLHSVKDCPVYKPSFAEFEDPFQYIQSIAKEASEYGICKIIPPFPPLKTANVVLSKDFKFKTTVQPLQANNGQIVYEEGRMRTLAQFEVQADTFMTARYADSIMIPPRLLEIDFWHELLRIKQSQVEYGINIEGSGFSGLLDDALASSAWNLKTFSKLPKCLLRHVERPIKVTI